LQQLLSAASHRQEMQINRHHRARRHPHPFTPSDLDSPKRKELTMTMTMSSVRPRTVKNVSTPDRFGNDKAMAKKQTSKCPSGLYFDIRGIASQDLFLSSISKMDLFYRLYKIEPDFLN
jgi:ssDNA-specific exonuclease RecJ